jgi:hypothetical protein
MTKIVLNGAPGSGKTKLAYDLQEILGGLGHGYYHIIDRCAEDVAERYDFGIGPLASHITDLSVVIDRLGKEYYARNVLKYENFIVIGSVAEAAINMALTCDVRHTDADWETGQIVAPIFPLFRRSSGISFNFLLPLGDDPDDYEGIIFDSLPITLEALQMDYHRLHKEYSGLWIPYILKTVFDIDISEEDVEKRLDVDTEDSIEDPGEVHSISRIDR